MLKYIPVISSAAVLSGAMIYWREFFFFAKISYDPEWVIKYFYDPMFFSWLIVFSCLLLCTFAYKAQQDKIKAIIITAALSTLFAVILKEVLGYSDTFMITDSIMNSLFQYIFIAAFYVLVPTLLMIVMTIMRFKWLSKINQ